MKKPKENWEEELKEIIIKANNVWRLVQKEKEEQREEIIKKIEGMKKRIIKEPKKWNEVWKIDSEELEKEKKIYNQALAEVISKLKNIKE